MTRATHMIRRATKVKSPVSRRRTPTRKPPTYRDLNHDPYAITYFGDADGSINKKGDKLISALPFIRDGKRGRCWWSVKASGDHDTDYEQGREWARMFTPLLKYNIGSLWLSSIVVGMVEAGDRSPIASGFISEIGDQLNRTRAILMWAVVATDTKAMAGMTPATRRPIRKQWRKLRARVGPEIAYALV